MIAPFTWLDVIALGFFISAWFGYTKIAEKARAENNKSVTQIMEHYRHLWFRTLLKREQRMIDTSVMQGLQNGTAFFASTSLFAIGGNISLLKATDDIQGILNGIPFVNSNPLIWKVKILLLTMIFVYAFFKLAWAYRLFNYSAILIGAAPVKDEGHTETALKIADKGAKMNVVASRHFNRGIRAFFFALGYLGWFIHPILFICTTALVWYIVYRRQFASDALEVLIEGK